LSSKADIGITERLRILVKKVGKRKRYNERGKELIAQGAAINLELRNAVPSKLELDILIPSVDKDLDILPYVIDSAKKNILHPIKNIYIVSPDSEKIKDLCTQKGCIFIDERSILPITKKDIKYNANGLDRSGWLYQQLLKWAGDVFCTAEYFLVLDSDTVLIRPQVFEVNGKIIFDFADEYHKPYFDAAGRLLNKTVICPVSFTSHHILIQVSKMRELKDLLEKQFHTSWYEAIMNTIDKSQMSGHSDYETYGQFMYFNYKDEMLVEYWSNLSLRRDAIKYLEKLQARYGKHYKTLSFHSYNE
jgi:hypothetical protein